MNKLALLSPPSRWGRLGRLLSVWLVVFVMIGPEGLLAATYYVSQSGGDDNRTEAEAQVAATPWRTITRALTSTALTSGDEIVVAPGTYDSGGSFGETYPLALIDGVTLRSSGGAAVTEIRGPGDGSGTNVIVNNNDLGSGTVLDGFKVTNGSTSIAGDLINFRADAGPFAPQIRNNIFTASSRGVAVFMNSSVSGTTVTPVFHNNVFSGMNTAFVMFGGDGGPLTVVAPELTSNTFTGNLKAITLEVDDDDGGAYTALISGNTFTSSTNFDLSILVSGGANLVSFAPTIAGNTSTGAGIRFLSMSAVANSGTYTIAPVVGCASTVVLDCTGEGNTIDGGGNGAVRLVTRPPFGGGAGTVGVFGLGPPSNPEFSPLINSNTITNTGGDAIRFSGQYLYYVPGGALTISPTIANNAITDPNGSGIAIELSNVGSKELSSDATVTGNSVTNGNATAIRLSISAAPTTVFNATWTVSDNNITYAAATTTSATSFVPNGISVAASIDAKGSVAAVFAPTISRNTISDRGTGITTDLSLFASVSAAINATPAITQNTISNSTQHGILSRVAFSSTTTSGTDLKRITPAVTAVAPPKITVAPLIHDNTVDDSALDGLQIQLSGSGTSTTGLEFNPTITSNRFRDSTANGINLIWSGGDWRDIDATATIGGNTVTGSGAAGLGVGVFYLNNIAAGSVKLLINAGNQINNNLGRGISLYIASNNASPLAQTVLIDGNTISGNGNNGLSASMFSQTLFVSNDISIVNNQITNNTGFGLGIGSSDWRLAGVPANAVLVSCNTMTGNTVAGIVQQSVTGPPSDFGGGNRMSAGRNNIYNNGTPAGTFDFVNFDADDGDGLPVFARNNYWQTTNPDPHIFDNEEGPPGTRAVDFTPARALINACGMNPVALPDMYASTEDTTLNVPAATGVLANDTPPGAIIAINYTQPPQGGSVIGNADGSFSFTPAANFNGTATFTYQVTDGIQTSAPATVTITVAPVNDAPVASPDNYGANQDTPLTVPAPGVLGNDVDVDAGTLAAILVTPATSGTVLLSSNGGFTYTPATGFIGTASFTYKANDGIADSNTVTVTINVNNVNDPPVAVNDTYAATEDTPLVIGGAGVLTNDFDPDNDPMTAAVVTPPTRGTLVFNANGTFTYTPNANLNGPDTFTYRASDGTLTSNLATVTLNVTPVNDAPVANPDTAAGSGGSPITTNVLANDTDVEGNTFTVTGNTQGANGTVTCTAMTCTYMSAVTFTGTDSYTYTVTDSGGASATGVVNVTVTSGNRSPIANNDTATGRVGTAIPINVLINDSDPDGDPISIVSFSQGARGTVSCSSTQCTYTGSAGAGGNDSFTYTIGDGRGLTATATVAITLSSCPSSASVLSPADGATNVPTSGFLGYSSANASQIRVYFGPAGTGCSTLFATTTSFASYSNLAEGTQYEVRVEGVTPGCPVVTSGCSRFTTLVTCPLPPSLISPVTGSQASPGTFRWTAVPAATSYELFIGLNGDTPTLAGATTGTELSVPFNNGTITWYVVAIHPRCGRLQSSNASFNACNVPAAPIPFLVAETTSAQSYTYSWTPTGSRYEVQEAANERFTDGVVTTVVNGTQISFTKVVSTGTPFFYRVRAFSECNQSFGPFSDTLRVAVLPPPIGRFDTNANVPAGSTRPVTVDVFVEGVGRPAAFTAAVDKPFMSVEPKSGNMPAEGLTFKVTLDPSQLENGAFTGTLLVTFTVPAEARRGLRRASLQGSSTTTTKSSVVTVTLATPATPASRTSAAPESLILPIVGHLEGAVLTFRSDVRIANSTNAASRYDLTLTPTDRSQQPRTLSIDVSAGSTTALDDIVRRWYGIGSLGESSAAVLQIRPVARSGSASPGPTLVSSRTFTTDGQSTLGQFVPPVAASKFIGTANAALSVERIAQTEVFRTNLGLVESAGAGASLLVSVFNNAGTKLREFPVELVANEQRQLNNVLAEQNLTLDDGRIEVKVVGGGGKVTAYASVIDNRSKDQFFSPGIALGSISSARYVLPGAAHVDGMGANWRTDMRLFNSGTTEQTAALTFYPQGGAAITRETTIKAGEVKAFDDVVSTLFGVNNGGGSVHVSTANTSSLNVTGRTYNGATGGNIGQFIPAATLEQGAVRGGAALHVLQLEDSARYRSNIGLAEMSGQAATAEITIFLPDTKVTPRIEIPLAANEFRQIAVLKELNLGNVYNARVQVRVTGGNGRVTTFGSLIDLTSSDATYIPPQQ